MPTPGKSETRKEFVDRCIPIVIGDGTAEDGAQATAVCNSMWEQEKMTAYLLDNFVTTKPGEPFRLFPFGQLVKNGKTREITPEYAARFRLPHFKPPIKLGSHNDETPAGGFIIGLEVRDDGLYAVPEWNDKGTESMNDGAYRYQSPEVIWDDGALEDPTTGKLIEGPLILGDALLHTPHLGEAAALYTVQPIHKGDTNMSEFVQVPKTFWEGIVAKFSAQPEPEQPTPEPVPVAETDEFQAVATERDNYKAELDALKAEKAQADRLSAIVTELQDKEKFGSMYVELEGAQEAADVLASMDDVQREWVMRNFRAHAAQIDFGKLEGEQGQTGGESIPDDPRLAFDAAIRVEIVENKLTYAEAAAKVAQTKPELYQAYQNANKPKE